MADPMARGAPSLSGLTEEEARSFHGMFVISFFIFTAIALVAHYAVWQWRPWIPGVSGYKTASAFTAPALTQPTATAVATR
ncbi:MAG: light-harvesting antenna LH1, beta subunit [bacterium]